MGTVTKLYALTTLLNPEGVINTSLMRIGIISHPISLLYNQGSVIFGLVYQMVPFAMLPLYVAYKTIPLDLLDAAQGLGARRLQAFLGVVFPLTLPSTVASWFIVYVLCTGFFLTPVLLGGLTAPFASSLISQAIFEYYNLGRAVAASLVLLTCGVAVLLIGIALVGRERFERAIVS
jgi:ABC-type spermidine/putrescine transport system permease subunit I